MQVGAKPEMPLAPLHLKRSTRRPPDIASGMLYRAPEPRRMKPPAGLESSVKSYRSLLAACLATTDTLPERTNILRPEEVV